jgi:hypothetical protein
MYQGWPLVGALPEPHPRPLPILKDDDHAGGLEGALNGRRVEVFGSAAPRSMLLNAVVEMPAASASAAWVRPSIALAPRICWGA